MINTRLMLGDGVDMVVVGGNVAKTTGSETLGTRVSVGAKAINGTGEEPNEPQLVKIKLNRIKVQVFLNNLNSIYPNFFIDYFPNMGIFNP